MCIPSPKVPKAAPPPAPVAPPQDPTEVKTNEKAQPKRVGKSKLTIKRNQGNTGTNIPR